MSASFKQPTIGPKSYIAQGSSGWPESFVRRKADCDLDNLLADHGDLDSWVGVFVLDQEIQPNGKKKPIEWCEIVAFLHRITGLKHDCIPASAAVAFWARVMLHDSSTNRGTN